MDIGAQVDSLLINWHLAYLACGILFGLLFVFWLVNLIDIHAQGGSLGFRLMILPTSIILWPLILVLFITRISTKPPPALETKQSATKGITRKGRMEHTPALEAKQSATKGITRKGRMEQAPASEANQSATKGITRKGRMEQAPASEANQSATKGITRKGRMEQAPASEANQSATKVRRKPADTKETEPAKAAKKKVGKKDKSKRNRPDK